MRYITILGATGSIGASTLEVIKLHPDRYKVFAVTAYNQMDRLEQCCLTYNPTIAVVSTPQQARALSNILKSAGLDTEVLYGEEGLIAAASDSQADTVMAAIVGAAGLKPTLAAAKAGKRVLLANKEALVMSGKIFMDAVNSNQAKLLPIDSEHNAVFQSLPAHFDRASPLGVRRILLTASGGPFLNHSEDMLAEVTPDAAVRHPNWVMGRKISVDSASLMNKGLEVIEAHWLFGVPANKIEVVVHPQSIIHSLVEYIDGSVIAELGNPDMRVPIAHALGYPERLTSGADFLDLIRHGKLTFTSPDPNRFPCLNLAYAALNAGGSTPAALNAANEIAVAAFLENRLSFTSIPLLIEDVLNMVSCPEVSTIEEIIEVDASARHAAMMFIDRATVH